MTEENKHIITYRMDRAKEALVEAKILINAGHTRTSVSRLYYACFYAVSAYMYSKGQSRSKHTGVREWFHQKMVKKGLIHQDIGKAYNNLFDNRQKADYDDLVEFEIDAVEHWFEQAKRLVYEIGKLIGSEL
ncbi:MAG: HEPN domain-containing protein [Bacillota bacterium]